jgi:hypothetical protein
MGTSAHGGVSAPTRPLALDGSLLIDGERVTVTAVDGAEVRGVTRDGKARRLLLTPVEPEDEPERVEEWRFGSALLEGGALGDDQLREAAELLGHLNEAWFGHRSCDPGRPGPGEPRARFDPAATSLGERLEAKAQELGCTVDRLRKKRRGVQREGLGALVDGRTSPAKPSAAVDPSIRAPKVPNSRENAKQPKTAAKPLEGS